MEEDLATLTGVTVSHSTLQRLVQRESWEWPTLAGEMTEMSLDGAMHLERADGVMIGRAAYDHPYLFAEVDQRFFGVNETLFTRAQIVEALLPYIDHWTSRGLKLNKITRHLLMLFAGQPGSRHWRRILTEESCKPNAGVEVVQRALQEISLLSSRVAIG